MIARILLTVLIAAFAGSAMAAGVHKWTDDDGVVHYGERPPQSAEEQAEEMRVVPPPNQTLASAETEDEGGDGEFQRSAEIERLLREEQCVRWTAALAEYRAADFLTVADEAGGEQRRMTTQEAAAAIVRAEGMVASNCVAGDDG